MVPPEGGLESQWDSQKCLYFIHVTVKIVSGMTPKCKIESWNTHVSSSSQETLLCKSCFLEDRDSKEGQARSLPIGTVTPSVLLSMHVDPHHVKFVSLFYLHRLVHNQTLACQSTVESSFRMIEHQRRTT